MFRLSNGFFILLKNLSGGCHNEVDAPETGLNEARGLCPDAPGFLNLIPGIWTSDHPPQENTISHAFQRSKIFLFLKEPTNDAKVRERDFVCFVFFAGKLVLTCINKLNIVNSGLFLIKGVYNGKKSSNTLLLRE